MPSGFLGSATVLGSGVVFESNVLEALNAALEIFPSPADCSDAAPEAPVYIVLAANHTSHIPPREHRICGKRLHIAHAGISLEADGEHGCATCTFCLDAIGTALFRETVHTAALFLVAQRGRTPVHASAVVIGNCACVLAGRSGSGKSSLALAANSAGLPVLAEDTVFVQLDPALRIWGLAGDVHILENTAPPGTEARTRLRSGRLKYAVPIARARPSADSATLYVLARGDQVSLDPLPPETAVRMLTSEPESGYEFYGHRMEDAIRAIAGGGCWQLTLADDPNAAIARLIENFGDADAEPRFR